MHPNQITNISVQMIPFHTSINELLDNPRVVHWKDDGSSHVTMGFNCRQWFSIIKIYHGPDDAQEDDDSQNWNFSAGEAASM